MLELLNHPILNDLREGFEIGVRNSRSTTVRGPHDGGVQERDLARKYRNLASKYKVTYPRVFELVMEIAISYDIDAQRHDERATMSERWHP